MPLPPGKLLAVLAAAALGMTGLTGCAAGGDGSSVRLGYFPNLTHAPAIIGVSKGYFAAALGQGVDLQASTFNAGPAAIEALNADSIDIAFVGPNPTITGYTQSRGQSLRVVAGAAANGAFLVVRDGITGATQLRGARLATPQLGNTQDVALRYWLKQQGFATTTEGGGDVSVLPQDNSTALQAFADGQIDGAWVPEPWATRLVSEAGGRVLVDEADLWPDQMFVVTNVIVRTQFLAQHPDQVKAVLSGLLAALDEISDNPDEAQAAVNQAVGELTGKPMDPGVLRAAWKNVVFTADPLASTLRTGADHAVELGLLESADLSGLYALDLLNELLVARDEKPVGDP